jgi:spermidine/putrescine ABC transporter ATP-binding subunit
MSQVSLTGITKRYAGNPVVSNVNLDVAEGEFVVFLGPSGCGKTTTLRMIAGFVNPSEGSIRIGGEDVTYVPPRKRNIGMVFQNYALFPNMTVAQNIGFGLRQRKVPRSAADRRVSEMLALIQLGERSDHHIDELSGGQQQRVALARALAASPRLLLMDEPLGALDLKLRESLQIELLRIQRELKITTVLVTHDQQEAMVLADRIVIMANGQIQQVGRPRELYECPANAFVADFIGKNNLMQGDLVSGVEGQSIRLAEGISMPLSATYAPGARRKLELCVRPEHLQLFDTAQAPQRAVPGVIEQTRFLGNVVHYLIRTPWDQIFLAEVAGRANHRAAGDKIELAWDPQRAIVFNSRAEDQGS